MNQKVSNKISYLYFTMSILILNLHSVYMAQFKANELAQIINQIIKIICNMSVPTFFFISALLFYRNCENKTYTEVIKIKFKTLIIPYLCWNIICLPLKELKNIWVDGSIDAKSPWEIIYKILMSQYDPVLWFVRVLFIYFLLYPAFLFIIKKRSLCFVLIIAIFALNIYIGPVTGYSTARYWLPIYLLGGYLGYWQRNIIFNQQRRVRCLYIILTSFVLLGIVIWAFNSGFGMYVCRMVSPLCYWVLGDIFLIDRKPKWIEKQSFFIYCTQMIFSIIAQKIWLTIFGKGIISAIFANIGIPFILLFILIIVANILHKIAPKLYSVLTGGRIT